MEVQVQAEPCDRA